jgi:transposase-like protein
MRKAEMEAHHDAHTALEGKIKTMLDNREFPAVFSVCVASLPHIVPTIKYRKHKGLKPETPVSVRPIHTCQACYAGVLPCNSPWRQVMGRPPSGLDEYLDWQQRLESQKASGLSVDVYCLQEGVSRSTFYRWVELLREGIPESIAAEGAAREQAEAGEARFLPVSLRASPVEIALPNGGVVRLPLGVGQAVLLEVIRVVGALRPWRAPNP